MNPLRALRAALRTLRVLAGGEKAELELRRELKVHINRETDKYVKAGLSRPKRTGWLASRSVQWKRRKRNTATDADRAG